MLNFNYCKLIFKTYKSFTFSLKYLCQKMIIIVNIIKNNKHAFNSFYAFILFVEKDLSSQLIHEKIYCMITIYSYYLY